jgi:nitrous oxide reductase
MIDTSRRTFLGAGALVSLAGASAAAAKPAAPPRRRARSRRTC